MKNTNIKMMSIVVIILMISTLGAMLSLLFHENRIFGHLHVFFGVIMFAAVVFHFAQNWKWVCLCMFKPNSSAKKGCVVGVEGEI